MAWGAVAVMLSMALLVLLVPALRSCLISAGIVGVGVDAGVGLGAVGVAGHAKALDNMSASSVVTAINKSRP